MVHVGGDSPPGEHASCGGLGPVHVDLGTSFTYRKPVVELVKKRLPASLELAAAASLVQLLLGLSLGAASAVRKGKKTDRAVVATSVVLGAAPRSSSGCSSSTPSPTGSGGRRSTAAPSSGAPADARASGADAGALRDGAVRAARARGAVPRAKRAVRQGRTRQGSHAILSAGVWHALRNALAPIVQLGVLHAGAIGSARS